MTTQNVTISKEQFAADLQDCLTLLEQKSENTFLCEYTSPSFRTWLVLVTTY